MASRTGLGTENAWEAAAEHRPRRAGESATHIPVMKKCPRSRIAHSCAGMRRENTLPSNGLFGIAEGVLNPLKRPFLAIQNG
jgi:hypothetical protein